MKIAILSALVGTGRMASVDFVTDKGKLRTINGRTGVRKHTKGVGAKFDPQGKGLLSIWETPKPQDAERNPKNRYRYIRAENVRAIRADGVSLKVSK